MVVHGAFKDKKNAYNYAKEKRSKGYAAVPYQKSENMKWYVSVVRTKAKKVITKRRKRR